jgi:alpha-ribazole phosphatase
VPADDALSLRAAQVAAAILPPGLPVWVSGLRRAQQLATHLQSLRPDLAPVRVDARLNEMNFGRWELQPWDAVPQAEFDAWLADFANHRFGGVETTQGVIDRVIAVLADVQASLGASGQAVWITHSGVIRAAQYIASCGAHPITDADQWPRWSPAPGESMSLVIGGTRPLDGVLQPVEAGDAVGIEHHELVRKNVFANQVTGRGNHAASARLEYSQSAQRNACGEGAALGLNRPGKKLLLSS